MTASSPRPAAPDATGGELRSAIARALDGKCIDVGLHLKATDAVLALPALRDLLAERDTLAAQVQAVEGLAEMWDLIPIDHMETRRFARMAADRIRRALGTPTTGGGE